jgi:hypothetical protein
MAGSRNADVEGSAMIHALEAGGVAWLMINVALFVALKREDAMALCRRTIDRFWRAVGVLRTLPTTSAAEALIETGCDTEARALGRWSETALFTWSHMPWGLGWLERPIRRNRARMP